MLAGEVPRWRLRPAPDPQRVAEFAAAFDLHPRVARLLCQRLAPEASPELFLDPGLARLEDPGALFGLAEAVPLLVAAVRAGRRIAVFGDYDVDGVTGAALLGRFLRAIGAEPLILVPERVDGYGLTPATVARLVQRGAELLITVDNGIAAEEGVRAAMAAGLPVIVTDHHDPPATLPPAAAIVHPRLGTGASAWRWVAGAGVALALVVALRRALREAGWFGAERPEPNLQEAVILAGVGTIADVVPLVGTNRILAAVALDRLARGGGPLGLQLLVERVVGEQERLAAEAIAYQVAPPINAAGRVGRAAWSLELLLTEDPERARALVAQLVACNQERKRRQRYVESAVEARIAAGAALAPELIFAADPDWDHGVLGIVAGRLARRYGRPTFLFQIQEEVAKGSARSAGGVDLMAALAPVRELAVSLGGHREAAGMSVLVTRLGRFRRDLSASLARLGRRTPVVEIDAELPCGELDERFLADLERLEPFGAGNPVPRFVSEPLLPQRPWLSRDGRHLFFTVPTRHGTRRGACFGGGELRPLLERPVQLVYRPVREWRNGVSELVLRVETLDQAPGPWEEVVA